MDRLIGPLTTIVLLLAALAIVAWVLKRTPVARALRARGGNEVPMRALGMLALSPSQRVVAVEVGSGQARQWLVLGVSPQSIHTLATLEPDAALDGAGTPAVPSDAPGSRPGLAGFGAALNQALRK